MLALSFLAHGSTTSNDWEDGLVELDAVALSGDPKGALKALAKMEKPTSDDEDAARRLLKATWQIQKGASPSRGATLLELLEDGSLPYFEGRLLMEQIRRRYAITLRAAKLGQHRSINAELFEMYGIYERTLLLENDEFRVQAALILAKATQAGSSVLFDVDPADLDLYEPKYVEYIKGMADVRAVFHWERAIRAVEATLAIPGTADPQDIADLDAIRVEMTDAMIARNGSRLDRIDWQIDGAEHTLWL